MDYDKADLMGIKDQGKWLPFAFLLPTIIACKMTTDDLTEITAGCTTIFCDTGESFIIDTPYDDFLKIFQDYYNSGGSSESKTPEL